MKVTLFKNSQKVFASHPESSNVLTLSFEVFQQAEQNERVASSNLHHLLGVQYHLAGCELVHIHTLPLTQAVLVSLTNLQGTSQPKFHKCSVTLQNIKNYDKKKRERKSKNGKLKLHILKK